MASIAAREDRTPGTATFERLVEACQEIRAASSTARARSDLLCKKAALMQQRSLEVRLASRPPSRYARVEGTVDGHHSVAIIHRDGTVVGERTLLRRVHLVVALGDSFGDPQRLASIGHDPLISTLSTARAYDAVRSIDVFAPTGRPHRAATGQQEGAGTDDAEVLSVDVQVEESDSSVTVRLRGELDVGCTDRLAAVLADCVASDRDVAVELSGLSFLDAAGASVLVAARGDLAGRGRSLVLRGARGLVRRTLELTGAGELLAN